MSGRRFAGLRGEGRGWLVLSVGFGWFLTLGTRFVLPTILPQIRAGFHVSNTAAGVAVTAVWLTYGGMQFPAGALIDRVGERRLLAVSLLVGGVSLLAFAGAPTFAVFLLACVVYGLGTGLYGPARATVLSRRFPDNDGAAFGAVLAFGSVGAAAIPLAVGVLTGRAGWRFSVGTFTPLFLVVAAAVWWAVPGPPEGTGAGRTLLDDLGGLRAALGRRTVIAPGLAIMFMLFAFEGLTAFLPTYFVTEQGFSQALAAAVFAGMFASGAVFQVVTGAIADRVGHRRVLVGVGAGSVVPLLALPFVTGLPAVLAVTALFGLRFAAAPLTNAYIVRALPEAGQGTAWGLVRTSFFVVGSTGSILVGALADHQLFGEAFLVLAGVTVLGTFAYLAMPPRAAVEPA